jgi:hypothetical protein
MFTIYIEAGEETCVPTSTSSVPICPVGSWYRRIFCRTCPS